jgi:hypothetical protein
LGIGQGGFQVTFVTKMSDPVNRCFNCHGLALPENVEHCARCTVTHCDRCQISMPFTHIDYCLYNAAAALTTDQDEFMKMVYEITGIGEEARVCKMCSTELSDAVFLLHTTFRKRPAEAAPKAVQQPPKKKQKAQPKKR